LLLQALGTIQSQCHLLAGAKLEEALKQQQSPPLPSNPPSVLSSALSPNDNARARWCSPSCQASSTTSSYSSGFAAFLDFAEETGIDYLPLAGALADCVLSEVSAGRPVPEARREMDALVGLPYWESQEVPAQAAKARRQIAEAAALLRALYAGDCSATEALKTEILSVEGLGLLVGKVQWNAIGVGVPHAVARYCMAVNGVGGSCSGGKDSISGLVRAIQARKEKDEKEQEEEEEEEEDSSGDDEEEEEEEEEGGGDEELAFSWGDLNFTTSLFTPYEAVALFPLVAALNHSCRPNCTVTYLTSNQIVVLTTKDLPPGEELSISYVDETKTGPRLPTNFHYITLYSLGVAAIVAPFKGHFKSILTPF